MGAKKPRVWAGFSGLSGARSEALDLEERSHRHIVVYAQYGFREQVPYGQNRDGIFLVALVRRGGVGYDELVAASVPRAVVGGFGQNRVRDGGPHGFRPLGFEYLGGGGEGACGLSHVVYYEYVAALNFADEARGLHDFRADSALGDESQRAVEKRRVALRAFEPADVRRENGEVADVGLPLQIVVYDGEA